MTKKIRKTISALEPFQEASSEILLLGTVPGEKSQQAGFYYQDARNRFWKILAGVFGEEMPRIIENAADKYADFKSFLSRHHIALYDVYGSCENDSSLDKKAKNRHPSDLSFIAQTNIKKIFLLGKRAEKFYESHQGKRIQIASKGLPSTSGCNTHWTKDDLVALFSKEIKGE